MNHSLHKVSLLKIAAFSALVFILSVFTVVFITPFFPDSSQDFLVFLAEVGIVLAVSLFIVRHLSKRGISLRSIVGETSVIRSCCCLLLP